MLDTRFPRPPGDVGHPDTFPWPVRRVVVQGAAPRSIVTHAQALRTSALLPAFVSALRQLEAEGAHALTTSCGFLVLLQAELQAAVRIPLLTSGLLALPGLLAHQREVGVLTISAQDLGDEHLLAAGVPRSRLGDVRVEGLPPTSAFVQGILGNADALDLATCESEVVAAACRLRDRAPHVRAVVLECTNMPPYAAAIHAATGWSVHSLVNLPALTHAMVRPQ